MKSIARFACLVTAALASQLSAQEHISWVNDFRAASGLAAEQRRLVLLHFYNDNCEPCLRLEQNVFNRPEVAEAVHQNYIAVKVHAGQNPQLAARYRVNRWPTDVFVTPVGQEVFRTISPQKPSDYVAVLHQVAQQTGIGTTRSWGSQVAQSVVPVSAQANVEAQRMANAFEAKAQQATTAAQSTMQVGNERLSAATNQFQQVTSQTQQAAEQAASAAQHGIHTANQWGQQAAGAVQQYQQQASDARDQRRNQAGQFGQQFQQSAQVAQQQLTSTAMQTAQQFEQTAANAAEPWQQAAASIYDRRSAFVPQQPAPEPAPAATPQSATAPTLPQASVSRPSIPMIQPPPTATMAPSGVPLPQENPWMAGTAKDSGKLASPPMTPASSVQAVAAGPSIAPPAPPASEARAPQPPPTQAPASVSSVAASPQQPAMVPASQAPPIALDGFCPVTLLDTMARNPGDRSAWKKGDKQFGAIHRGRTYLFTSPECQQKFLASPDAYAPALSGCDPVRFAERGEFVDGKRAYGLITPDRQIYLFADEASRNRFEQSPATFSAAIQQALRRSESGNVYR